ncbi:hypothetical protein Lupro_00260 [Lutibacter profundi]|uniref:FAD/NAD(P)-binding domain-containing protein n=1 Tax=Lutibacter profundi TaxID=1622118 RepID=A0A120IDW3_9FLAO|nr:FAD-dependent oxidoreductase [Lutibacter profundi]AMC09789.1 hypothetical protein Lupro_00260 [Lutibacter profundi]
MNVKEAFNKHYIAVIGGSISGSEAAYLLAEKGFKVVVFDMNKLPYGKIEDGLPNWHINLRNRQISEIDAKLDHPNIRFVPKTKIGRDINFLDLINNWGFSAIILANGAWKDRKFPIPAIEKFKDKELIYQNSFINWFNHKHEHDYMGKNYFIKENTVIVGGGLASLDVVKIVMIELVKKQLFLKKGIDIDLFTLEKQGIKKFLEEHAISFEELDLKKATLVYRRTAKDMPLKLPKDDSEESIKAAKLVSEKLLNKYAEKYVFNFIPLSIPVDFREKEDKLTSVIFQKVIVENGKIKPKENSYFELKTAILISSIGSIPEQLEGLEYEHSSLKMRKNANYQVVGFENVFAVGNAVTGRGNIQESKQHGKQITTLIIDEHLTEDALEKWLTNMNNEIKSEVNNNLNAIVGEISKRHVQPKSVIEGILDKINQIHKKIGYTNYRDWIKKNTPDRLEDILKNKSNCKCI